MPQNRSFFPLRSNWTQAVCPAPKRFLQRLLLKHNLKTGLDIGCGDGSPLTPLRAFGFHSTGIDISEKAIARSRAANAHDDYLHGDFRTMEIGRKFDVVMLSHLIEHFTREDGQQIIRRVEELATRLVYIETPNGFVEQLMYDGNPFQRHISGWFTEDFESRGYNVFGAGWRSLRGSGTRPTPLPGQVVTFLTRATQWYIFRRPRYAAAIAAIKFMDPEGNILQL